MPEMRSARRWTGALPVWASSTSRAIWASAVSAPTLVARTIRRPPALTVAPAISEPGETSTGTDSPVSMLMSTALVPSSTMPSVATFSPGRTTKRSPTLSCSTGTRRSVPSASRIGDVLGAELQQGLQGGAGAALGLGLEVAPGEQEGGDDAGGLQVDLVGALARLGDDVEGHAHVVHAGVAEEQRVQRPQPRGQRARREISVSIVAAPCLRLAQAALWNGHAAHSTTGVTRFSDSHWKLSNCSAGIIASSSAGIDSSSGEDQAVAQRHGLVLLGGRVGAGRRGGGQRGLVAGGLDGRHELLGGDGARVELDPGLLGGVVDRGGDAVELVELALDAVGARGAGHAGDRQLDALDRGGAHRVTSWVKAAVCRRPSVVLNCRNRR